MRKAIIAVLSVILVFAAAIPVFSVKAPDIDGDMSDNTEWLGSEYISVKDNTDSKFGNLHAFCLEDKGNNTVYYAVKTSLKSVTSTSTGEEDSERDLRGAVIEMPNKTKYVFPDDEVEDTEYDISYAVGKSKNNSEVYFEMKVVYKDPDWNRNDVTVKIQLSDDEGNISKKVEITVKGKNSTSPEDYGTTDSSGGKTTKASKTTTEKSTKTTTQKLTGGSRVPTTRRGVTTSAATTTKKPTEPQTTAAKTTSAKVRTTKAKTTRTRTTKAQSSRETASYAADTGETTVVYMLDAEALSALINTTTAETQADRSAFGIKTIPRSTLLKGVTAAAALILFGIIGAWAVKSRSDDDEPPKDEKEDSGDKADNNEKED